VLLITLALTATAPAHAASGPPDPDAPPGASRQWLPDERWVMDRWTPFDETRLYDLLGTTREEVEAWLADSNGRRTLEALAAKRGIARATLTRKLLEPRRGRLSRRGYDRLRRRTNRVLTQSHLSQHVLFHEFHMWAVRDAARETLGLTRKEWKELRDRPEGPGVSVAQLAHDLQVPFAQLRPPVMRAIERAYRRGIRGHAISRRQAAVQLTVQRSKIDHWPLDRTDKNRVDRTAHLLCEI
jgi:hypothetical protein